MAARDVLGPGPAVTLLRCRPAAGRGCGSRGGRRARRPPSGPRTCGRPGTRGRRRAPRDRGRVTAPPGPHRRGTAPLAGSGRRSAISAIGWIVPTSLLASMIATRIVRSVDRRVELVRVDPTVPVHRQLDDLEPELLEVARACGRPRDARSSVVTIRCPRALPAQAAPFRARLFASVPPDVKTISRGWALSREARRSWASSSTARARRPKRVGRDWVAERLAEVRQHRVDDLGPDGVVAA